MNRMLALVAALLITALTFSASCHANVSGALQFTIEPSGIAGAVKVRFERQRAGHSENNWDSFFQVSHLTGLDMAALNGSGTRPIRFALAREPGRIDCAGTGGNRMARGSCAMTADPRFDDYLAARGIARPTEDQTFGLIALNVHRSLIQALAQARYPTPTIDKLIELTAVDATPSYISALANHGYRPQSLDGLVQFAAMKITPDFIGSFVRAGYGNLKPDELVQLKALDITPAFIAGFDRLGYGRLPIETLVELKAMDITPDYVRAVQQGGALPSPDHLVQLRAVDRDLRSR